MDVDQPLGEPAAEVGRHDLHVAGEHHQVDVADELQRPGLGCRLGVRGDRHVVERHPVRAGHRLEVGVVGDDGGDLGPQVAGPHPVEQLLQHVVGGGDEDRQRGLCAASVSRQVNCHSARAPASAPLQRGPPGRPGRLSTNSSRSVNTPPTGSEECCWDSMMFAPGVGHQTGTGRRRCPGRSGQRTTSRPTSASGASGAAEHGRDRDRGSGGSDVRAASPGAGAGDVEQVAVLLDPGQHVVGAEPHDRGSAPSRSASTSSQPSGVDTVATGRARSEYGATVVFAVLFWLQSTSTLPGRSAFSIRHTTSLGCLRGQLLGQRLGVAAGVLAVGAPDRRVHLHALGARGLRPPGRGRRRPAARAAGAATCAHSTTPAGGPGSRSSTSRSGSCGAPSLSTCHCGTCTSSAARLADQTRSGTVVEQHHVQRLAAAGAARASGTVTARTQSGACRALFFSKNACPSTPSGQRVKVTGRPARCGSSTGAIRT